MTEWLSCSQKKCYKSSRRAIGIKLVSKLHHVQLFTKTRQPKPPPTSFKYTSTLHQCPSRMEKITSQYLSHSIHSTDNFPPLLKISLSHVLTCREVLLRHECGRNESTSYGLDGIELEAWETVGRKERQTMLPPWSSPCGRVRNNKSNASETKASTSNSM